MNVQHPRVHLAEAISLFRDSVRPATREGSIESAVRALVDGLDSPGPADFAGRYPDDAESDLVETSDAVVRELGLFVPAADQIEAVRVRREAVRLLDGVITARELACWAHRDIGHHGLTAAQPFVDADNEYDTIEYTNTTVEQLDTHVREQARAFLADPANDPWAESRPAC